MKEKESEENQSEDEGDVENIPGTTDYSYLLTYFQFFNGITI